MRRAAHGGEPAPRARVDSRRRLCGFAPAYSCCARYSWRECGSDSGLDLYFPGVVVYYPNLVKFCVHRAFGIFDVHDDDCYDGGD